MTELRPGDPPLEYQAANVLAAVLRVPDREAVAEALLRVRDVIVDGIPLAAHAEARGRILAALLPAPALPYGLAYLGHTANRVAFSVNGVEFHAAITAV